MNYCVGKIDQVPQGEALIVDVNGISIGIFNENGNVYAVRNVCPHKQAPVCKGTLGGTNVPSDPCEFKFGMEGQVLRCPWHGWEFDLATGEALFGTSNRKVKTYPVEIKDHFIYVNVG
ncbi:Rieske (2Fe-2S) protein [Peribacillus butanolivorans]